MKDDSRVVFRRRTVRDRLTVLLALRHCSPFLFLTPYFFYETTLLKSQLLAMDVSAQVTMKDAAKCDKHCEWQNSANQ